MPYALARKGAVRLLILALLICAAHLQALALGRLLSTALLPSSQGLAGPFSAPNAPSVAAIFVDERQRSADRLLERNPFDSTRGSLLPKSLPEDASGALDLQALYAAPACEGVTVLAIAASADSRRSLAVLASPPAPSRSTAGTPVRQGDDYRGKRVWFIAGDRAWLSGPGSLCQATLFAKPPAAEPATAAPQNTPLDAGPLSRVRQLGPSSFAIDRSLLDALPEAMMGGRGGPLRAARIKPELENGKPAGLRLQGVGPGSPLTRLGLEDGDRLEAINGVALTTDPASLLEAYARLRTTEKLQIALTRRGQKTTLDYVVR